MTERDACIAFNLTERIGSVKAAALAGKFGSLAAAWKNGPAWTARGGGPVDVEGELRKAAKYGVAILTPVDPGYPRQLKASRSHPLALYIKGDPAALSKPSISIVGTRRATSYGLSIARNIARDLAADGWCIVSGLAHGIDAEAHRGALEASGTTVAVLGSALDKFYPEENRELGREIAQKGGAVVSEFPFGRSPDMQTFPQRNHVVAGLSNGVIAVESPRKSGTLITCNIALEIGRTVMAVPGRIDSNASAGCLELIRNGARLVRNAKDVEEEMRELSGALEKIKQDGDDADGKPGEDEPSPPSAPSYSIEESIVLRNIDETPVSMDVLAAKTRFSPARLNVVCLSLRMKGRLCFLPGNRVASQPDRTV